MRNDNKARDVVGGSLKRYRARGQRDEKIRTALITNEIAGFVIALPEKNK